MIVKGNVLERLINYLEFLHVVAVIRFHRIANFVRNLSKYFYKFLN